VTRLLGIDLGSRRIGVALAVTQTGQVRPLATLRRASSDRDRESNSRLVMEHAVDEIVVGLPLSLDGRAGPQVTATRAWAEAVLPAIGLPIAWRDERMTTERSLERLGGPSRGASGGPPSANARRAHRARLDREAAVLILQAEIDARADEQYTPR
jgi:putative Holliday junction resolvase